MDEVINADLDLHKQSPEGDIGATRVCRRRLVGAGQMTRQRLDLAVRKPSEEIHVMKPRSSQEHVHAETHHAMLAILPQRSPIRLCMFAELNTRTQNDSSREHV